MFSSEWYRPITVFGYAIKYDYIPPNFKESTTTSSVATVAAQTIPGKKHERPKGNNVELENCRIKYLPPNYQRLKHETNYIVENTFSRDCSITRQNLYNFINKISLGFFKKFSKDARSVIDGKRVLFTKTDILFNMKKGEYGDLEIILRKNPKDALAKKVLADLQKTTYEQHFQNTLIASPKTIENIRYLIKLSELDLLEPSLIKESKILTMYAIVNGWDDFKDDKVVQKFLLENKDILKGLDKNQVQYYSTKISEIFHLPTANNPNFIKEAQDKLDKILTAHPAANLAPPPTAAPAVAPDQSADAQSTDAQSTPPPPIINPASNE